MFDGVWWYVNPSVSSFVCGSRIFVPTITKRSVVGRGPVAMASSPIKALMNVLLPLLNSPATTTRKAESSRPVPSNVEVSEEIVFAEMVFLEVVAESRIGDDSFLASFNTLRDCFRRFVCDSVIIDLACL